MAKARKVSNITLLRVYFLFGIFVLFGLLLVSRIVYLQLNSAQWDSINKEERISMQKLSADRGNILAENGTILATSLPFYKLAIDPLLLDTTQIPQFNDSLKVLSKKIYLLLGKREGEKDTTLRMDSMFYYKRIREAMKQKDRHLYVVSRILNYREYNAMITFPILNRKRKNGGANIVERFNNKRFYPYGDVAKVTLGTMAEDSAGLRGIEYSFNDELKGKDGFFLAARVPGGHYVPIDDFGNAETEDGYDVVTTLDVDFQDIAERAVEKAVLASQAKAGVAILMEVETGKVKAIVNYPETYNYAISGLIEPGSTFKLVSALAALEEKVVDIDDSVDTGSGAIRIEDREFKDDHPIGKVPYRTIFAKSSNVGISLVTQKGFGNNPKKFIEYVEKFGFKSPAIRQMKGEPHPIVLKPGTDLWSKSALPSMSIGYSVKVTPMQLLSFYNAVANGGKWVEPYLIKEIRNNASLIRKVEPRQEYRQICSFANVQKAKTLMEGVVEYGTAKNIKGTAFKICGKTGTARKVINGQYVSKYRASFVGFFPADKPVYSCIVMIDEPEAGSYYGADVAAPVFKEIAEKVYTLDKKVLGTLTDISVEPKKKPAAKIMRTESAKEIYEEMDVETSPVPNSEWAASTGSEGHQINLKEFNKASGIIPDVRGASARDALSLLESMGVKVYVSGVGKVKRQSLSPGTKIVRGTGITLFMD